MSIDRDPATLIDIAIACRSVIGFIQGHDRAELDSDDLLQSAVLHKLLILGEAVRRLSAEFRARHPEMDWRGYIGLRNILIHRYDQVDLNQVWKIATRDVPELHAYIQPLLPDEAF